MEGAFVVHVLMNSVNTRLATLVSKRVVVQNIGPTVSIAHGRATIPFTLNPRVQGFLTLAPMQ